MSNEQPRNQTPRARLGRTQLAVGRIGLCGSPLGTADAARNWDPFTAEGHDRAVATVRAAIDAGINFIDTAPSYGEGHSEEIIGKAIEGRRDEVILCTRVPHEEGGIFRSVEGSLRRLRTDCLDIAQFHAAAYRPEDVRRILDDGPMDALERLREQGKVRFLGFGAMAAESVRALIASFRFDVVQVRYSLIEQSAAEHVLGEARQTELGVVATEALTGGVLPHIAETIAPRWQEGHDVEDIALKFVLADGRVDVATVAIHSPEEASRYAMLNSVFDTQAQWKISSPP